MRPSVLGYFAAVAFLSLSLPGLAPAQNLLLPNPKESSDLTQVADAAAKDGKNTEAEALYLQAVGLDSKNGKAWRGLAKITRAKGDMTKAISFLKEGWSNGDIGSLKDLGTLLIEEGKNSDFQELVPDLMKLKNSDVECRSLLVFFKLKGGTMDREVFSQVMAGLRPEDLAAKNDDTLRLFIRGYEELGSTGDADTLRSMLAQRKSAPNP